MGRAATAAAVALAGLLGPGGCASVPEAPPAVERALASALEARRLDAAAGRVLRFRDGLLGEATDPGRIDRVDRAAAARRTIADLRASVADVHRGRLDAEGRVDLDLALFLLDGAEERIRLADMDEGRVVANASPAQEAMAGAAPDAPPTREVVRRLRDPGFFAGFLNEPTGGRTAEDLRASARRLRHAASHLRRLGDQAAILYPGEGEEARKAAQAAAERAEEWAKRRDEEAKSYPGGKDGGFAPPCGRDRFVAMLRFHHGVFETPEALEAWGLDLLARTHRELEELAAGQFPGRTWKEAMAEVRRDHATAEDLPAEAFRAAEEARDFCLAGGLVTIPPEARLGHVSLVGDEMARSYPFAAYSFRLATASGESGRYMVSPGATWMSPEQREERLLGNCRAWTRAVAAHEMWPGHHLQFWIADRDASALRREAGTPVFVEGWGLYSEWLLERHGYFRTPAERLAVLVMRAWRACRVVLDVRLHCGECTPEQAVDFLAGNAATTRDAATAEVTRYMTMPTQPFSYAWGWREILRLRSGEEARLGARFDERAFHDRLLRCGPIPFPFVRRLFGDDGDSGGSLSGREPREVPPERP